MATDGFFLLACKVRKLSQAALWLLWKAS